MARPSARVHAERRLRHDPPRAALRRRDRRRHQQIFDTIYAGSTVRYSVLRARALDDRVILAHVLGKLNAPAGSLAGETEALAGVVLLGEGDDHRIAAFHNTMVGSG
jgi:hypothetical protein